MVNEVWKDIPGYESKYQVSNLGNVRSLNYMRTGKTVNLKSSINSRNRKTVRLYSYETSKTYNVETLVTLAFIGKKPKDYHILHADGDSLNNKLSNLSYDTVSQNAIDTYRYGKKSNKGKLSIEQVLEIRRLFATGKYYQWELAGEFNVSPRNISDIVNRKYFSWLNDDGTIEESNTAVS